MKYVKYYKFRVNSSPGIIKTIAPNLAKAESMLRSEYHISLNHLLNLVSIDKLINGEGCYKYIKIKP